MDGKNLNRVYPGKADGTQTERIAFAITPRGDRQAPPTSSTCTAATATSRCGRYSYWQMTGDASSTRPASELALAFGLDHIVIDRERPKDPARAALYTSNTAVLRGKPAITVESGGHGAHRRGVGGTPRRRVRSP